jgi:hypothetical protein
MFLETFNPVFFLKKGKKILNISKFNIINNTTIFILPRLENIVFDYNNNPPNTIPPMEDRLRSSQG